MSIKINYKKSFCDDIVPGNKTTIQIIKPELEKKVLGLFTKHCYKKYKGRNYV